MSRPIARYPDVAPGVPVHVNLRIVKIVIFYKDFTKTLATDRGQTISGLVKSVIHGMHVNPFSAHFPSGNLPGYRGPVPSYADEESIQTPSQLSCAICDAWDRGRN